MKGNIMEKMKLVVDTGAITVSIVDKEGNELGEFNFVPTDFDIIDRYENTMKYFRERKIEDSDEFEFAKNFSNEIKEQIDILLNSDASKSLFAKCSPLTPLADGTLFFENVLEQIGVLVEKTTKKRIESTMKKVEKATEKYK